MRIIVKNVVKKMAASFTKLFILYTHKKRPPTMFRGRPLEKLRIYKFIKAKKMPILFSLKSNREFVCVGHSFLCLGKIALLSQGTTEFGLTRVVIGFCCIWMMFKKAC
jgi:hypothetical protein